MIPKGSAAILHLAGRIASDLIPKAPDAYAATDLGFVTALLGMVAQDYDRAADVTLTEIDALRTLLRRAAPDIVDAGVAGRISGALAMESHSRKISDLTTVHDALMRALIEVHGVVEDAAVGGADWAAGLDLEIWRFLDAHVAAHAYDVPL